MPSVQRFKTDSGEVWVKAAPGEKPEMRAISRALIEAPEKSNRQIARIIGVDDKTVGKVRGELEGTAEIPQLDKTIGADGKARTTQPARRPISTTAESQAGGHGRAAKVLPGA